MPYIYERCSLLIDAINNANESHVDKVPVTAEA